MRISDWSSDVCSSDLAGDRWPVALHHLVGDAAPQHRPALVHEAGEESVRLVVGDSFLVVDAAVQGDVDAEGQESHGVLRSRCGASRLRSGSKGTSPGSAIGPWRNSFKRKGSEPDPVLRTRFLIAAVNRIRSDKRS